MDHEHAPSRYELLPQTVRRFLGDFRARWCALVQQRTLSCCPSQGLDYKAFAGPKPACSQPKEDTMNSGQPELQGALRARAGYASFATETNYYNSQWAGWVLFGTAIANA
jgi:hypothetical protein